VPSLTGILISRIAANGPMTFEQFMEAALYDPDHGYYARASKRTGRAGDFLTSVDVGPVFGELLARQIAEMHAILGGAGFDLVEAAAGNGQLAHDVLQSLAAAHPESYRGVRLHLVERSAAARHGHRETLGVHADRLATSAASLPERIEGVIYANELLDALPCHAVTMTSEGLREIVVDVENGALVEREDDVSTPEIGRYLERLGVELRPGWRAEVNLRAAAWVRDAARRLARGFLIVIDYGHRAGELYSASHSAGTRASYRAHVIEDAAGRPAWLRAPGEVDITAHVDLTSIEQAATAEGLTTIAVLDQTYFLLGLGLHDIMEEASLAAGVSDAARVKRRLALKNLIMPGALGSTLKVMLFARGVGAPSLLGCSYKTRLT
jgi:SAM-dependent MidA family methyltransferase